MTHKIRLRPEQIPDLYNRVPPICETLSLPDVVTLPVRLALFHWMRRSELSADRVGAVFAGSPQPMVEKMIRLAGSPRSITGSVNVDLYLK